MAYSQEARQLKDYEVLGVGASRRDWILKSPGAYELQLYPSLVPPEFKATYDLILEETLGWLKPQAVYDVELKTSPEDFIFSILEEEFKENFPLTVEYLKTQAKSALQKYLEEFPWQGPLATAHFRYFPHFLKRHFQDSRLYLIAQSEWLWSYLSFADFGFPPEEEGRVFVNPSLQNFYINIEVPELNMAEGLYILYYDATQAKVREYKLDIYEAAVVDLLQEDRKFSLDQLLDQVQIMELDTVLSREQWVKKVSSLQREGIIIVSLKERDV